VGTQYVVIERAPLGVTTIRCLLSKIELAAITRRVPDPKKRYLQEVFFHFIAGRRHPGGALLRSVLFLNGAKQEALRCAETSCGQSRDRS